MRDTQGIIERVRRISAGVQRVEIAIDPAQHGIQPGQFFLARVTRSLDPYLREPWIPVHRQGNTVTIERSLGFRYDPGQVVQMLGPLGKPVALNPKVRNVLLLAIESTPVSLLMLAEQAIQANQSVMLVLIGAAQNYPLEALPEELEVIRAPDQFSWTNQKQAIGWAEQVFAVAPPPDNGARYAQLVDLVREIRVELPKGYLTGFFQPPMPCGVGACGACLVRGRKREMPSCTEGPAFDLLDLVLG